VIETAFRELKEESGLSGKLTLTEVRHKMDYSEENQLLEDKFFFTFRAENLDGKLIENFEGGKNMWLSKKEILELPDLFPDVEMLLGRVDRTATRVTERKYVVKKF
jgi:8-oxo-dGTP pyrophosphatase MutT (NUDIX family)